MELKQEEYPIIKLIGHFRRFWYYPEESDSLIVRVLPVSISKKKSDKSNELSRQNNLHRGQPPQNAS